MNEPVDQFLGADFSGPAPPRLRQAVLAATARVVRRRRYRRYLAWGGLLAATFLAGMLTKGFWQAPEQASTPAQPPPLRQEVAVVAAQETEPPSLVELEWRAFDSQANRATLFFEVGQRYFEEQQDLDAALRCYRQALDAAPLQDLEIRPDDNWLVMALKEARQKEKNDANP